VDPCASGEFKQRRVWTLAPADQLLHVCVHGPEGFAAVRSMVADAVTILNCAGAASTGRGSSSSPRDIA